VRPDISQLVYRLPEPLRAMVAAEVRDMKPETAKTHVTTHYGGLLGETDTVAYLADYRAQQEAKKNGHAGGVKTAMKRRMGLIPAADSAGKRWKPDYRGPLDKTIFPEWGKVPMYVPPLNRFMGSAVRGTIIAIGDVVDHKGRFVLPRAVLAESIGTSPRVAYAALETLRDAGLIEVKAQGDRNQATVWSYVPVAGFDTVRARRVLQTARTRATERIVAATQP
jgi:hypothetical protein